MNDTLRMLELHELDQLLALARAESAEPRWKRIGLTLGPITSLEREREKLAESVDRRWRSTYERSLRRYGRGLHGVRERICLGCFVTLPTSAAPPPGESQLHLCESCGRLLFWA